MRKTVFFLQGMIISILVLVLFTPIIWTSEIPEIRIELDSPGIVFCNTSRNEENILEYNGTITADFSKQKMEFSQVLVSLRANTGGWDWEITPSSMILSKDNERFDFLFQISVPNNYPAENTNIIRIKGEASTLLGLTSTIFSSKPIEIQTAPFINQSLETSGEGGILKAGTLNTVDFRLNNRGNVPMESRMTLQGGDNLMNDGWNIYFQENDNLTVGPFQSVHNTLYILPPFRMEGLDANINVTVTSMALTDDENIPEKFLESSLKVMFNVSKGSKEVVYSTVCDPLSQIRLEEDSSEKSGYLFRLGPDYYRYLKNGTINNTLKKAFENNSQVLSKGATLSKIDEEWWEIMDGSKRYRIQNTSTDLKIYKSSNGTGKKRLAILETLKFGEVGGIDLGIFLLLLGAVVSLLYYFRYRN